MSNVKKRLTLEECLVYLRQLDEEDSGEDIENYDSDFELVPDVINARSSSSSLSGSSTEIDEVSEEVTVPRRRVRGRSNVPRVSQPSSSDEAQSSRFVSRDGTSWILQSEGPRTGRTSSCNFLRDRPGPSAYANIRQYSTRSSSRHWPVHVFYNILDFSAINAWVTYRACTGRNISRRDFILELCEELSGCRMAESTSGVPTTSNQNKNRKRMNCNFGLCKRNKTQDTCEVCQKAVCGTCAAKIVRNVYCQKCSIDF